MSRARPLSSHTVIGRKQRAEHEDFVTAYERITSLVSREEFDDLLERTVLDVRAVVHEFPRAGYGWSGGKDSMALQLVCERAGVVECVLGISDLEFPEFLRWATDHMPNGLTVFNQGQDLEWLAAHPDMLFPDAEHASEWFRIVQHAAQKRYWREQKLDVLILGRRASDGNFMGRDGSGIYVDGYGVRRYAPLQHWRHEDILAAMFYYQLPFAPCYRWPRGFRVGTGSWPARQWTRNEAHGWSEVASIDRSVVVEAARYFPLAAAALG